jgi:hypothetical protein
VPQGSLTHIIVDRQTTIFCITAQRLLRAVQNGGAGRPNLVALGRQVLQSFAV